MTGRFTFSTVGLLVIIGRIKRQLNKARKKTISNTSISFAIDLTTPSCMTIKDPEIKIQKVHWITAGQDEMSFAILFIFPSSIGLGED